MDCGSDEAFRSGLVGLIGPLRAFARSLCRGNGARADDLAQDALARAWSHRRSFAPGTDLKAWLFAILRNGFVTEHRRSWREEALDPAVAEAALVAADNPQSAVDLDDLGRALADLTAEQREAIILVGAEELSYQEAADLCGVAIGTIKSRVHRAREQLMHILDEGRPQRARGAGTTAVTAVLNEILSVPQAPAPLRLRAMAR